MKVAEYSLRRNSKSPEKFDVKMIFLEDYPFLYKRERQVYKKDRKAARWRAKDPQSFTLLRFLPPQLMHYEGRAVIIDPDIFAVGDIYELLGREMNGRAILCRDKEAIETPKGIRHNYMTSVMLMDCSKLRHWQWEKQVSEMFLGKRYYTKWVMLGYEPTESIGEFEEGWNHLDTLNEKTKMLHNTKRGTQPWLTGLPFFRIPYYSNVKKIWGVLPEPWWNGIKSWARGEGYLPYGRHERHPDENQEKMFFTLLKECVSTQFITRDSLVREIRKMSLRADALEILDTISL